VDGVWSGRLFGFWVAGAAGGKNGWHSFGDNIVAATRGRGSEVAKRGEDIVRSVCNFVRCPHDVVCSVRNFVRSVRNVSAKTCPLSAVCPQRVRSMSAVCPQRVRI
jgi:hypothetical protein